MKTILKNEQSLNTDQVQYFSCNKEKIEQKNDHSCKLLTVKKKILITAR